MSVWTKLTMLVPADQEAKCIDGIRETDHLEGALLSISVEDHGRSFERATPGECVRGRIDRVMVVAILSAGRAQVLVQHLKDTVQLSRLVWWTEPLGDYGRWP